MVEGDEAQRAGRTGFQLHVDDLGDLLHIVADAQRVAEVGLAACPHPARQRHRRQKAAARRVAVGADLGHRRNLWCKTPVDRQRCGDRPSPDRRCRGRTSRAGPRTICAVMVSVELVRLADPFAQVIEIESGGSVAVMTIASWFEGRQRRAEGRSCRRRASAPDDSCGSRRPRSRPAPAWRRGRRACRPRCAAGADASIDRRWN